MAELSTDKPVIPDNNNQITSSGPMNQPVSTVPTQEIQDDSLQINKPVDGRVNLLALLKIVLLLLLLILVLSFVRNAPYNNLFENVFSDRILRRQIFRNLTSFLLFISPFLLGEAWLEVGLKKFGYSRTTSIVFFLIVIVTFPVVYGVLFLYSNIFLSNIFSFTIASFWGCSGDYLCAYFMIILTAIGAEISSFFYSSMRVAHIRVLSGKGLLNGNPLLRYVENSKIGKYFSYTVYITSVLLLLLFLIDYQTQGAFINMSKADNTPAISNRLLTGGNLETCERSDVNYKHCLSNYFAVTVTKQDTDKIFKGEVTPESFKDNLCSEIQLEKKTICKGVLDIIIRRQLQWYIFESMPHFDVSLYVWHQSANWQSSPEARQVFDDDDNGGCDIIGTYGDMGCNVHEDEFDRMTRLKEYIKIKKPIAYPLKLKDEAFGNLNSNDIEVDLAPNAGGARWDASLSSSIDNILEMGIDNFITLVNSSFTEEEDANNVTCVDSGRGFWVAPAQTRPGKFYVEQTCLTNANGEETCYEDMCFQMYIGTLFNGGYEYDKLPKETIIERSCQNNKINTTMKKCKETCHDLDCEGIPL